MFAEVTSFDLVVVLATIVIILAGRDGLKTASVREISVTLPNGFKLRASGSKR